MAHFNDLDKDQRNLANELYSIATSDWTPTGKMNAIVDVVAALGKKNDPEYQEFLRLQKKFPQG